MLSVAREVTEAEIARAKAQLKASLVMNLESATARADQIARQFLAFGDGAVDCHAGRQDRGGDR